ncbi:MAG: sulfotransferase [Planctomycetota bacterium]
MSSTSRPRYSLLFGQGRSGTNWFLDLFQMNAQTFCREAPYFVPESPFARLLPHRSIIKHDRDDLAADWDTVIDWTLWHMGSRDPHMGCPKQYLHAFGNAVGRRLIGKTKVRKALGLLSPGLRKDEWACPWWLGRRTGLAQAPAVIKLLQAPGWATFVLEHRPEVPVFQIVRHPGGFLNSWSNRYLGGQDQEEVLRTNRRRLRDIAMEDAAWGELFGDPEELDIEEAELWYWRYANEASFDIANGRANYRAVPYEGLATDPVPIMQELYGIAGLAWDEGIATRIAASASGSAAIAARWKEKLEPRQVELVERVMAQSSMKHLWDGVV